MAGGFRDLFNLVHKWWSSPTAVIEISSESRELPFIEFTKVLTRRSPSRELLARQFIIKLVEQ